jgi:hypothetical protein
VKVTIQQTEKLLTGNHKFGQLSFSMMLTRLKMKYSKDPCQTVLQSANAEVNAFLNKFKDVMPNDCSIISRL